MISLEILLATNASTDISSDGDVYARAESNYGSGAIIYFSLDNITWYAGTYRPVDGFYQYQFFGLSAGNYHLYCRVRPTLSSPWEYSTGFLSGDFTINFVSVSCGSLMMGTVTGTGPTTSGGSDGTISVSGVTAKYPVEYKLDAGAWGASTSWSGLSAGTHTVYVRYVAYPTCVVSADYVMSDLVVCTAAITAIATTNESSIFAEDCTINVTAVGTGAIQYSLDNGSTWQLSNFFAALLPGDYVIKIKDSLDCVDSRTVTVYKFKAPYFDWPIVNSSRMVITSGPVKDNLLPNFDNTLFKDIRVIGGTPQQYHEKFVNGEIVKLQWRSSYNTQVMKLYDEANTLVDTLPTAKVKTFMNQTGTSTAQLASAGAGKVQVFFSDLLPDFAVVGQPITISGTAYAGLNNTFIIKDITSGTLAAAGYVVLIIETAWPGGAPSIVSCTINAVYDQLPYDVYECAINWGAYANGNYYLKLEATDPQLDAMAAQSEPLTIATTWNVTATKDHLKILYSNVENAYKMFYETGIVNQAWVEGEIRMDDPGGEETVMDDSERRLIKLNEYVTRMANLTIPTIPSYLAERITLALAHDNITVNGVAYGKQDKVSIERNPDDDLVNLKVKLRAINFIAENGDDGGTIDDPSTVLIVNGVLLRLNP